MRTKLEARAWRGMVILAEGAFSTAGPPRGCGRSGPLQYFEDPFLMFKWMKTKTELQKRWYILNAYIFLKLPWGKTTIQYMSREVQKSAFLTNAPYDSDAHKHLRSVPWIPTEEEVQSEVDFCWDARENVLSHLHMECVCHGSSYCFPIIGKQS